MPSVVANLVAQNSTGSFNLGDLYNVSPKENTKSYNGSGSSNVGFVINTFSGVRFVVLLFFIINTVHEIILLILKKPLVRATYFTRYCFTSFINSSAPSGFNVILPFANTMLRFDTSSVNAQTPPG